MKKALFAILLSACTVTTADDSPKPVTPLASGTAVTVVKNLVITYRDGSETDGVANITCEPDEKLLAGGCACDGTNANNDAGLMFGCMLNGDLNGYVGGCYPLYNDQTQTKVTVRLTCVVAEPADVVEASPSLTTKADPIEERFSQLVKEYGQR